MCGIAKVLGPSADSETVKRMLCSQKHRGPDERDIFVEGALALGHTRPAVIDRSRAGRQPMVTPDGRHVLAYKGEVYNYQELRAELQDLGCEVRSATDAEVVLHSWA